MEENSLGVWGSSLIMGCLGSDFTWDGKATSSSFGIPSSHCLINFHNLLLCFQARDSNIDSSIWMPKKKSLHINEHMV